MKKILFIAALVAAILLLNERVNAQGLYVNAGVGYGFCLAPQNVGNNISDNSIESVRRSLGMGLNPGVAVGYMFNEHIGAELNINYLIGHKTTLTDNSSDVNEADVQTIRGNMLRITPAVKITYGETVRPYARLGLIVGMAGNVTQTMEENSGAPFFPVKTETTEVYRGGLSLGVMGAFGADFMFNETIGIFAELGAIAQSYAPTRSEITQLDVNVANQLPNLTTNDRETEYFEELDPNDPPIPESDPDRALKNSYPFSSWGLNVGVHIALGGE